MPHPTIISESGRAVVAYHSLLVFDVLGVSNFDRYQMPPEVPADAPQQVTDLFAIYRDLNKKNLLEGYHDAVQAMDEVLNMFNLGNMTIENACPDRTALLGRGHEDAEDGQGTGLRSGRNAGAGSRCCRTPISATSRSSSRCPIAGRSSSSSRSCRSIA